jgi:hypothetical protein
VSSGEPTQGSGRHWLDYATAGLAMVAAIAAAAAAGLSAWQGSISSDTERRQLRAYVDMNRIVIDAVSRQSDGEISWMTEAVWRNSGATPTRGLKIFSDVGAKYSKGPMMSFGDTPSLALGPGDEEFVIGALGVPTSRIQSFVAKGIAVYRDAFGHDRVTMACRTANLFDPETLKDAKAGDTFTLHSRPCGVDSCADEDCAAYREQIGDKAPVAAYRP